MANITRNTSVQGTSDSASFSVTVGGDLHVLFVVYSNNSGGPTSISGATIGGHAMTKQIDCINGGGNLSTYNTAIFTYIGTLSGSQAVTYSFTGANPATIRSYFAGYDGATTVDGAVQSGQSGGYGNPYTNSITSATTNAWLVGGAIGDDTSGAFGTLTNMTGLFTQNNTPDGSKRLIFGDSNATVSSGSHNQVLSNGGYYMEFITIGISAPPSVDLSTLFRKTIPRQAVTRSSSY